MTEIGAHMRSVFLALWLTAVLCLAVGSGVNPAAKAAGVLKPGSAGPEVVIAQHILYQVGYLKTPPDGVFGSVTERAVRQFQSERGLDADGVIGRATWIELERALQSMTTRYHVVQRGESLWELSRRYAVSQDVIVAANGIKDPAKIRVGQELVIPGAAQGALSGVELVPWDEAKEVYTTFKVATVIDVQTGKRFRVRRYYGTHHADSEPLTAEDTAIMREIFGGWSWQRRPIIIEVDGRRIAASMNGMPHGQGSILENDFPGHFCIHFLGSRIHKSGAMDVDHQTAVLKAAGYSVERIWLASR